MPTGNPTHAELVAPLLILARSNVPPDIQELLVAGNPMMGVPPGVLRAAIASVIDSQASRIEELEAALRAASEVVDVAEKLTSCRADDDWIWSVQETVRAALGGKP